MRKTILAAAAALLACFMLAAPASADPLQVRACLNSLMANGTYNCVDVSSSNPLPVTPSNTSAAPLYVADAPYSYTALGCQQITSLSAAAPFASIPTGAKLATVTPEVQPVRYRDDGTAPTASIGPLLYPGLVWSYSGPLASIQFIQTAASATIDVCFYK